MKFNLKLFVLVGVFVGLRDVWGTEENEYDDGFIVGKWTENQKNEVKDAMKGMRVIKAVYKPWYCGNVPIIHESFKDKLSKAFVCAGKGEDVVKEVDKFDVDDNGNLYYNMGKNVEYTVYFIFKKECFDDGELYKLLNSTASMFNCCISLIHADLSNFNTKNVENMSGMFWNCLYLTELNLSNFDTKNVKDMSYMFSGCSSLNKLDLSLFVTTNVVNMSCMFKKCTALTELDVSKFDTQNVTGMTNMFEGCSSLAKLDLRNFNTKKVDYVNSMFNGCTSLNEVYLPSTCAEKKNKRVCCCKYVDSVYLNGQEIEDLNPKNVYLVEPENIIKEIST